MNALDWLARLIAIDTTSRNSNLQLIEVLKDWFTQHHIPIRVTRDPFQPKGNLFATIPARDGSLEGGIVLSGHTDVVPVDGQAWATPPFSAVTKEGRVYGRGACDMKGFLAVMLALVPTFQKIQLTIPMHFAFSYDEEIGCHGAKVLIADIVQAGIKPHACIVGEPTQMRPVIGHKGIHVLRCRVQGVAAHSSLTPQGCNAIEYAATLIHYIREYANQLRTEGPFDVHYDVPFTTISTNTITGGAASNIIPESCEFLFEFRHLANVSPETIANKIKDYVKTQLLPAMREEKSMANIDIIKVSAVPGFEAVAESPIARLAYQLLEDQEIHKVAYATEAGLFQNADIPTIVCGPGSIEQAHRPNEFITIEQLERCEVFLLAAARNFASVNK